MSAAVIRNCPVCTVACFKEEGCNKMTCPNQSCPTPGSNTRTKFCYLCRVEIQDYKHFCQVPHCSHEECGKCRLFTDSKKDDRVARREAAAATIEKLDGPEAEVAAGLLSPEKGKTTAPAVSTVADQVQAGLVAQRNLFRAMGANPPSPEPVHDDFRARRRQFQTVHPSAGVAAAVGRPFVQQAWAEEQAARAEAQGRDHSALIETQARVQAQEAPAYAQAARAELEAGQNLRHRGQNAVAFPPVPTGPPMPFRPMPAGPFPLFPEMPPMPPNNPPGLHVDPADADQQEDGICYIQ